MSAERGTRRAGKVMQPASRFMAAFAGGCLVAVAAELAAQAPLFRIAPGSAPGTVAIILDSPIAVRAGTLALRADPAVVRVTAVSAGAALLAADIYANPQVLDGAGSLVAGGWLLGWLNDVVESPFLPPGKHEVLVLDVTLAGGDSRACGALTFLPELRTTLLSPPQRTVVTDELFSTVNAGAEAGGACDCALAGCDVGFGQGPCILEDDAAGTALSPGQTKVPFLTLSWNGVPGVSWREVTVAAVEPDLLPGETAGDSGSLVASLAVYSDGGICGILDEGDTLLASSAMPGAAGEELVIGLDAPADVPLLLVADLNGPVAMGERGSSLPLGLTGLAAAAFLGMAGRARRRLPAALLLLALTLPALSCGGGGGGGAGGETQPAGGGSVQAIQFEVRGAVLAAGSSTMSFFLSLEGPVRRIGP